MLRSSVIVSALSLVSSLAGFANQLLIAQLFGATVRMDAYLVAISVPYLVMGITHGLFSFSLVPIQVRYRADPVHYARFSGLLLACLAGCAVVIPCIAYFLAPAIVRALAPTLPEALRDEAILMARVSWLTCGTTVIVSYLVSMQNAAKKFIIPVLVNTLPYLGMIAFSLLLSHELGPLVLVWGMLSGNLVAIPLLYMGIRRELSLEAESLTLWKEVRQVFRQMPLVLLSMLCFTVYGTIDAFWGSRLGASNVSYLGYGQRLVIALGNVVVLGPLTVMLPHLSEAAAQGREEQLRADTQRVLRMVLAFAAMAAVVASALRVTTVKLLFERGAFDRVTTLSVASILPWMFLGMVAMVNVVVLFRAFYAKGDVAGAVMIGGLGTVFYLVVSGLLSQVMGLNGIVAAYAATWWVLLGVAVLRLWRGTLEQVFNMENLKFLWQLTLALGLCGALALGGEVLFIRPALDVGGVGLGMRWAVVAGLGAAGFVGVTAGVFKMLEVTLLFGLVQIEQLKSKIRQLMA